VLGDHLQVLFRRVLDELLAFRVNDTHHPVVEVDLVVLVHRTHVVGGHGEGVRENQADVAGVLQHHVAEELEREEGELDLLARGGLDLLALLLGDVLRHAAGQPEGGMHLASAQHADDVHRLPAARDDPATDLHANLVDHAQDVALGDRRIRPHDEVRRAQDVEVDGVIRDVERGVEQLAQLLSRRRRIYVPERIARLGRGQVVRLGAHAADARGDVYHLLRAAPFRELLEPAQLRDDQVRVGDIAFVVEKDVNLPVAFQPGDGINADFLHIAAPQTIQRQLHFNSIATGDTWRSARSRRACSTTRV